MTTLAGKGGGRFDASVRDSGALTTTHPHRGQPQSQGPSSSHGSQSDGGAAGAGASQHGSTRAGGSLGSSQHSALTDTGATINPTMTITISASRAEGDRDIKLKRMTIMVDRGIISA